MPAPGDDWLSAGRVGRPHGLDGSFYVDEAVSDLLAVGDAVRVGEAAVEVSGRKGTDDHPILRLSSVKSREGIEALRGQDLWVARALVPPLGDDEFWAADLEGCAVADGDVHVGVVRTLMPLPSCEVLQVDRVGGGELLVPLIRDAVRSVDIERRHIDVDLVFLGEKARG